MNTELKYIKVSSDQIKQIGEAGEFEAVIATLNTIDNDGDIIVPGAFGDATISIMPAHDHRSVPLGKAKMQDRGDEAIAVGQFNLDIQPGKEWHSALKFDLENGRSVQEWSFGFRVLDSEEETRDGEPVRILKRLDVMEISPVLRGAGVNTRTLDVKQRFAEQLNQTLDAVDDTLTRAMEIAKMRADKSKPKSISDEHKARLQKIVEKCEEMLEVLADCDRKVVGPKDEISPEEKALVSMAMTESRRRGIEI